MNCSRRPIYKRTLFMVQLCEATLNPDTLTVSHTTSLGLMPRHFCAQAINSDQSSVHCLFLLLPARLINFDEFEKMRGDMIKIYCHGISCDTPMKHVSNVIT